MSSFKLLYPHIPFFDGFRTLIDPADVNTIQGSPRERGSRTGSTSITYDYNYGSAPFINATQAPTYLAIKGIKHFFDQSNNLEWFVNLRTASGNDTGAFNSTSLIDGDTLYTDVNITPSGTWSYYDVTFNDVESNVTDWRISKIFFGVPFDFGREPTINSKFNIVRGGHNIRPIYTGTIVLEAIAAQKAIDFYKYIAPHIDYMTFFLRDTDSCLFGKEMLYCNLSNLTITWLNDREADITFDYMELV